MNAVHRCCSPLDPPALPGDGCGHGMFRRRACPAACSPLPLCGSGRVRADRAQTWLVIQRLGRARTTWASAIAQCMILIGELLFVIDPYLRAPWRPRGDLGAHQGDRARHNFAYPRLISAQLCLTERSRPLSSHNFS